MFTILGLIIGALFTAWAVLSVVGNERQRRLQQIEAEQAAEEARQRTAEAAKALPGANLVPSAAAKKAA